jgi:hypothetical protein
MLKKLIISVAVVFSLFFVIAPNLVAAESIVDNTSVKYDKGNYNLNDMVLVAVGASRWILGIVGSLALLMFIYGGLMFLISAGSSDRVSKAKLILIAAVAGLAIVFASYLIIKFVLGTMGINWDGSNAEVVLQSSTAKFL